MDSKKKKKVTIIVVVVAAILIAIITVGTILGVKKVKSNNENNATNTNTTTVTNTYNEAIAEGRIPQNYNGVYQFKSVRQVEFAKDLTQKDIETICINKTSKPYINDLLNYLQMEREKLNNEQDEKYVFFNGQFNKNLNDNPKDSGSDHGTYVGNDNLSMVKTDKNEIFFISLNYADINGNIPVNDSQNKDLTKVYVMERVYSKENPNRLLFTVTYIYEMIDEEIKTIPDSELDFEL